LTLLVPAVTGRGSALVGCLASSYLVTVPYSPLFPDRSISSTSLSKVEASELAQGRSPLFFPSFLPSATIEPPLN
ncbi:hypothetical protein, partial [Leptolyngbya sp. FACHB-541]|uniref:hypothetical protein n=1 Tax=Leptolyngbya sp. FACHB-541 TaxID=2692810 RepID=UPI001A7E63A4